MKRVYIREEYCIGCRLCEIHCAVAHSEYPDNIVKAFKNKKKPMPRVIVEEMKPVSFALQCRHCSDAPCTKACITGAMQRDAETGRVFNQEERCVGCWTCILVCPYGAIQRDTKDKKVASKCDLCFGIKETPACVANCPNLALVYEERKAE